MKNRPYYLNRLVEYQDTAELIKVVSGVRRCGKSSLLQLYCEYLVEQEVSSGSIIRINLEDFQFRDLNTAEKLHDYISARLSPHGKTYILLDEVQTIPGWEKAVNSLRLNRSNDLYITGSNTVLLSGSLAGLLSGRYVEIKMLPLSYKEFLDFYQCDDPRKQQDYFNLYMRIGGFPGLAELYGKVSQPLDYLSGLYNTLLIKDVIAVNRLRDVDLLEKVIRFLVDNIGNQVTAKKQPTTSSARGARSPLIRLTITFSCLRALTAFTAQTGTTSRARN